MVKKFLKLFDKYGIVMCVIEMPWEMESQVVSMQLKISGVQVYIPRKVSYQEYDDPKFINDKIIIRSHVGVYLKGDYFYTVVDFEKDVYRCNYYSTKRFAEIEYQKTLEANK
jgi:hypothetical protein